MNKILLGLAMALLASTAYAKVENSAHDFNANPTYSTSKASRCQYCHVPHAAQEWANVALWATPAATGGTFTYYSNTGLVVSGVDIARSQTCLACHADGTTATTGLAAAITGTKNVGFNLQNDHPIGTEVSFTPGAGGMQPAPLKIGRTTLNAGDVSTVQCATCHSVHGLSSYTIQGRKLLYGAGDSLNSAGWASSTDFCNICHTR